MLHIKFKPLIVLFYVGADGYLIDFGDIKSVGRSICKSMNEYFIVPMKSDVMTIGEDNTNTNNLCMECKDGSFFSFPKNDCILLPIAHSSAEEIAHYIWCQIVRKLGIEVFISRGITSLEVGVAEAPSQMALFRRSVPTTEDELIEVEHCKFRVASGCLDC